MKTKNIKSTILISVISIITIFALTSKIGTALNSNQVNFKDGTGYYSEAPIYKTGEKKLFPFIKITDLFNREV